MSESPKHSSPKERFVALFKWLFFIAAFFLIIFTVMANMGGSSDTLKSGVEEYLSESTGYKAHVGTLHNISFFPNISVDLENLELRKAEGEDIPVLTVKKARLSTKFWDVARRTGRLQDLNLEELEAQEGVLLGRQVRLSRFYIAETRDGPARVQAEGTIGGEPVSGYMNLEMYGTRWNKNYGFGKLRGFHFQLGKALISGTLDSTGDRPVLEDLSMALEGRAVVQGRMFLYRSSSDRVGIAGDLAFPEHGSHVRPDLEMQAMADPLLVQGRVEVAPFDARDFGKDSQAAALVEYLKTLLGRPDIPVVQDILAALGQGAPAGCSVWTVKTEGEKLVAFEPQIPPLCETAAVAP